MTNLEAYNEITSAIRRAEYVDSDYADTVDVWALKVCERLLQEHLEADGTAGKAIYCKGNKIVSLGELTKQEFIYFRDKRIHYGWFMSWQLSMTVSLLQQGALYYAVKTYSINRENEDEKI